MKKIILSLVLLIFIVALTLTNNAHAGSLRIFYGKTTMIQILKAFGYPKQGINRYQSQHKFITYCHQLTNKNKCFLIYFKHTIFIKHINRNGKNTYTLNLKNIVTHMLTAIKQN
jgi:hypothetical protein